MTPCKLESLRALFLFVCIFPLSFAALRKRLPPMYYEVNRDLRLCPSPICGGYFIKALNRNQTKCLDGSFAPACYVLGIDASNLGVDESRFQEEIGDGDIVFGSIVAGMTFNSVVYADLEAQDGWNHFQKST